MKPKLRFKEFNSDWNTYKFYELVTIKNGQVDPNDEQYRNLPHIGPGNIEKETGRLLEYNLAKDDKLVSSKYLFDKESVIYGKINPHFAKVCYPKFVGLCSADAYPINPIKDKLTSEFLLYLLLNPQFTKFATSVSMRTGMPKINRDELSIYKFTIPEIAEQFKIGNMLTLLDKKIELQSKKIEDLKLFKLYTKNQLFRSGEKVVKLKDILNKWNEKNKDGSIKYVESISNKYGFISQSDQFEDRNIASKDLKNYYVIRKNVFGYNPSRLNVGSLALKENDNTSVVSPLYECFTTTQNNKFMLEWFDSKYFKKGTLSKFEGGVRNTLNFTNLCEIEINLPTLDKQNEFANYLYNFDKKIQLEELKLNKLNELKKGLMQNMFV